MAVSARNRCRTSNSVLLDRVPVLVSPARSTPVRVLSESSTFIVRPATFSEVTASSGEKLPAGRPDAVRLAAHLMAGGHGGHVAEQGRVDHPGQAGVLMAGSRIEQGGQAAVGAQARRQAVVGQRGARLVVRLVDERPEPGDL